MDEEQRHCLPEALLLASDILTAYCQCLKILSLINISVRVGGGSNLC